MKFTPKIYIILPLTAAILSLVVTSCNTASGFGKDVERLGDKIEKKAS